MNLLQHMMTLLLPLVLTNISHMLIVRFRILEQYAIPVWKKGLGSNKTWRGFIILPMLNAIFLWSIVLVTNMPISFSFLLGFCLGVIYLLFEFPNSYVKRRLGIAPGQLSPGNPLFFTLLDKTDSSLGVVLLYTCWLDTEWRTSLILFLAGACIHLLLSAVLVTLRLKSSL